MTNTKSAQYEVVRYPEPSLPWGQQFHVKSAGDGFDVQLVRTVADGSNSPRTLTLKTHYEPSQNLVVIGVRGAPTGAAEDIRASNSVARSNQAARDGGATTPAAATRRAAIPIGSRYQPRCGGDGRAGYCWSYGGAHRRSAQTHHRNRSGARAANRVSRPRRLAEQRRGAGGARRGAAAPRRAALRLLRRPRGASLLELGAPAAPTMTGGATTSRP